MIGKASYIFLPKLLWGWAIEFDFNRITFRAESVSLVMLNVSMCREHTDMKHNNVKTKKKEIFQVNLANPRRSVCNCRNCVLTRLFLDFMVLFYL